MSVSVETLNGLERKITVLVPTDQIEEEVGSRLKQLATKVKVHGFRPGKVPMNVVKQRYATSVREEVAKDMVQSTLYDALKSHELVPAGTPFVEPEELALGKDFKYTATFEVYPAITIVELDNDKLELVNATVTAADVTKMLDNLLDQNKEWHEVTRAVAKDDKVIIDFEGFVDDKPFEGGKASDYELILGSGSMIPGFEDSIIGLQKDKPTDIHVKFPADYNHADLAGKDTRFTITVKKIMEGKRPPLDDAFAAKFNITEGGVEALRKDIEENMTRELERRVSAMNREKIFDKLLEKNIFDIPKALIEQEIGHLKHEMYHRIFGHEHSEHEKIPDFPRELFVDQATRRVRLGLLFTEYVKKHQIAAEKARVDAMIEKFAGAYENPDELRQWYQSSKERLAEIEALVLEEMVADKIMSTAKVTHQSKSYDEVIHPQIANKAGE